MHIVLLLVTLAFADTLKGRVTDQSGQPVALAIIEIVELGAHVTTTADGAFGLSVPSGTYTLIVTRAGFAPASRRIAVLSRSHELVHAHGIHVVRRFE